MKRFIKSQMRLGAIGGVSLAVLALSPIILGNYPLSSRRCLNAS